MIAVYHNKNFLDSKYQFGEAVPTDEELELVAYVNTDEIETAFMLTNHIECAWWENREVKAVKTEVRSTSVGDVCIKDNGEKLICRGIGWDKI